MREVLLDKRLGLAEKSFFLILNELREGKDALRISRAELQEITGVSLVAQNKYIKTLVDLDYISYQRIYIGKGRPVCSEYRMLK